MLLAFRVASADVRGFSYTTSRFSSPAKHPGV